MQLMGVPSSGTVDRNACPQGMQAQSLVRRPSARHQAQASSAAAFLGTEPAPATRDAAAVRVAPCAATQSAVPGSQGRKTARRVAQFRQQPKTDRQLNCNAPVTVNCISSGAAGPGCLADCKAGCAVTGTGTPMPSPQRAASEHLSTSHWGQTQWHTAVYVTG